MSNEMIERVANVIREQIFSQPIMDYDLGIKAAARLAIQAMFEPTEKMLDAGDYDLDMKLEQQWKRMIEAALKDD